MTGEKYCASRSRNELVFMAGVLGMACDISYLWYSHAYTKTIATAKATTANQQLARVVATATEWMANNPADHTNDAAIEIEKQFIDALVNPFVTDRQAAEGVLTRLRQTRESVLNREQQAKIKRLLSKQLASDASEVLKAAKTLIEQKDVLAAIVKLRQCLEHAKATEKTEAQRLLTEAEYSISDTRAYETLILLHEDDFFRVTLTRSMIDRDITHSSLVDVYKCTVRRNIERAIQRRQELRELAEARRTIDRLTAAQLQYNQSAKTAAIKIEASLAYLAKGYVCIEKEIQNTDTALRKIDMLVISSRQKLNAPWSGPTEIVVIDAKRIGAAMSEIILY